MGVRAPSDLAVAGRGGKGRGGKGRGGEGEPFCAKKIHNARILEFCIRDTKALILCKKEKRLQFSRLVKPF